MFSIVWITLPVSLPTCAGSMTCAASAPAGGNTPCATDCALRGWLFATRAQPAPELTSWASVPGHCAKCQLAELCRPAGDRQTAAAPAARFYRARWQPAITRRPGRCACGTSLQPAHPADVARPERVEHSAQQHAVPQSRSERMVGGRRQRLPSQLLHPFRCYAPPRCRQRRPLLRGPGRLRGSGAMHLLRRVRGLSRQLPLLRTRTRGAGLVLQCGRRWPALLPALLLLRIVRPRQAPGA